MDKREGKITCCISPVEGVFAVSDGSGGVGELRGGGGKAFFFSVLSDHFFDVRGLLILGRGIGVGGRLF